MVTKVNAIEAKTLNDDKNITLTNKTIEDVNKKILYIRKFTETQDLNALRKIALNARIEEALENFVTKHQIDLVDKNREVQTFRFKLVKNYFGHDGSQKHLMFQSFWMYFTTTTNGYSVLEWKFKWLSNEIIKPPTKSDSSLSP